MLRLWLLAMMAAMVVGTATAEARTPIYRDPATYKGIKKAPRTKAPPLPAPGAPVTLSDAGSFPDVYVDEAGTAHVVWNESRGDGADVVVYCRIKRRASGCDARSELSWNKDYGVGDGPQFNVGDTPKIVRVGDQLVVFSHRYPTMGEKPDGASSSTVVAWSSADGGSSWTPNATIVGKWSLGQMAVLAGEDPTILNFGFDPLCDAPGPASVCLEAYRSGAYSSGAANLSEARDSNYYPGLVLDEHGVPVVASEDLARNVRVRRWTGAGAVDDPATWTPGSVFTGDNISLAGGPAGVYLMAQPATAFGPYSVTRLNQQGAGYAQGPAVAVTGKDPARLGRLYEGPAGHLIAGWEQSPGVGLQVRATGGPAGASPVFGPAQTVAGGSDNGQLALGAAADGGGFIAFNHTGGINSEGQIQISAFGQPAANGLTGLGGIPGAGATPGGAGTNGSCSQLSFGSFVASAQGCLLKGTGANAANYVTAGEINLWGLRIIPEGSAKIIINPRKLTIDTTGVVRVVVTAPAPVGDITLFRGEIHRDLSAVRPGTTLFEFPTGDFKANILGFDVGANIRVRLEKDGVHIPVDLRLPPAFGGFSGHAELIADRVNGLHVDSLHIHIGPLPLGALIINRIDLDYRGAGDVWSGDGSITVPAGGTLDVSASFAMGDLKQATLSFKPGTPIPIGPFVYLIQFGGGFGVEPVVINANATIGAGAAVGGSSPVEVHGDFTMTFPKSGPADFRLKGTVGVFFIQVGDGSLRFQSDGYADFGGHVGSDFGPLGFNANMDGFVDATSGQFGASLKGDVHLCVDVGLSADVCASANSGAAVSSKGFAVCARINPPDPIGGFEAGLSYPWGDWNPAYLINPAAFTVSLITHIGGCHLDDYRLPPPRASAAQAPPDGSFTVQIPAGLPSASILVQGGAAGTPHVTATGPGGQSVAYGAGGKGGVVMIPRGVGAAYVMLDHPAAGTWTISPQEGSPPITSVMQANGYLPAQVRARLGGRGRKRTIRYSITRLGHGQSVSFQESGRFGTRIIGSAKGAAGTLRFAPADAKGGRRTVVALVERAGVVTDRKVVGSYVAPGPLRPGAPGGLRVRRRGTTLKVTWRAARGAGRYVVTVSGSKGTRVGRLLGRRARSVSIPAMRRGERQTVTVRALSSKGRPGPARKRRL